MARPSTARARRHRLKSHRHRFREGLHDRAERLWRRPLALAVAVFAACGPAQALGYPDLVFDAVLVALALCGLSLLLGLYGLNATRPGRRALSGDRLRPNSEASAPGRTAPPELGRGHRASPHDPYRLPHGAALSHRAHAERLDRESLVPDRDLHRGR